MSCIKCPHHIKQGRPIDDGKDFIFEDLCGLKIKQTQDSDGPKLKARGRGRPPAEPVKRKPLKPGETLECVNFPFEDNFDYIFCSVYQDNFKSKGIKNGVLPTKDINYSGSLSGSSITDMELL